jgi:hypothetical protein
MRRATFETDAYALGWVWAIPGDPSTAMIAITGRLGTDRENQTLLMTAHDADGLIEQLQRVRDDIRTQGTPRHDDAESRGYHLAAEAGR